METWKEIHARRLFRIEDNAPNRFAETHGSALACDYRACSVSYVRTFATSEPSDCSASYKDCTTMNRATTSRKSVSAMKSPCGFSRRVDASVFGASRHEPSLHPWN